LKAEGGGIAACAVDLPGHGERFDRAFHHPSHTLRLLETMVREIDHVYEALADPKWKGAFDLDRVAIGGMSAGGMAALRRLCDDHPFVCAAVEGTTGCIERLYRDGGPWRIDHDKALLEQLDAMGRLDRWRPIPLLALHAELDEIVPVGLQRTFVEALRGQYMRVGADPGELIKMVEYGRTGAPQEHAGFGRLGNEAKNEQTAFLARWLVRGRGV
jgi:pimeloyl-ACP methyl ester carboxylesterase